MPWHAHLSLDYTAHGARTVLQHAHDGPLRVFKSLYPEGEAICHNVIVHPPGGLVGGDVLDISVRVGSGAHGFIGTPGATRFYAADEQAATQRVHIALDEGARLEWLPLEAIAYPGCHAVNHWQATLAPGAELMAWDVTALGLPSAGQPFDTGQLHQRMAIPGVWLEEARIAATDQRLLNAPLGLAGQRCMGTLVLATGSPLGRERREALLAAAQQALGQRPDGVHAGVTSPHPRLVVVRALAPLVEPLMAHLQQAWAALRPVAWGLPAQAPRIWQV
ncbi:MAG: urease accessory protein UreD [Hydrogenophaga sp.]|uniref:urease accessory protein UreD n=1 Tax=Hydrogenophaga sp. TaxID=1904254 RepID=UPI003D9B0C0B